MALAKRLIPSLALPAFAIAAQHANAFQLSGTFTGIAHAEALPLGFPPPRPESYYEGAVVSGSFAFYSPNPQFHQGGSDYAYFTNAGGSLWTSFTIKDAHFEFVSDESVIFLGNPYGAEPLQTVNFQDNFMPKYHGSILTLQGVPGSLFSNLDASTLHLDPLALPQLSATFADGMAAMRIDVDVNAVSFDATTPVPEPASVVLLLAGLLIMVLIKTRPLLQSLLQPCINGCNNAAAQKFLLTPKATADTRHPTRPTGGASNE